MATLEELRNQYYANLMKSGQDLITDLPPLPKETVEPLSGAETDALNLARTGVANRPDFMNMGVGALGTASLTAADAATKAAGSTEAFDPQMTEAFMNPFQQQVIDEYAKEMQRQFNIQQAGRDAKAVGAGAFGGSRQAIAEQELQRNIEDRAARTAAQLRSAAYTGAQNQAQSAFENQMKRGQGAGQLFQSLGTGIGALGEAQQALGQKDVNALFNVGSLEQQQLQSEYDVQRAAQLEEAYEPFARFSYMRDILSGVPSSGTSLAASATPQASPLANVLGGASTQISAGGGQPLLGGLGTLKR